MRGRSSNFEYLGAEILKALEESDRPMSALGVNFTINNRLDRIVELNTIKNHLNTLIKERKVIKKEAEKSTLYILKNKNGRRN